MAPARTSLAAVTASQNTQGNTVMLVQMATWTSHIATVRIADIGMSRSTGACESQAMLVPTCLNFSHPSVGGETYLSASLLPFLVDYLKYLCACNLHLHIFQFMF